MSLRTIRVFQRTLVERQAHPSATSHRCFARAVEDEDKGKIPAHIAVFTLLLLPCIAYSAVFYNGRDARQDELEKKIRERYGDRVQEATTKNQAMADFYKQAIVDAESGAQDDRLMQVLYGGKGDKKRFHAIDKELYGTHLGVEEKKKAEEEIALEKERRRERRQRRKEKRMAQVEGESTGKESESEITEKKNRSSFEVTESAAVVSIVVVAAIAGFFLGGNRR